MRREVNFYNRSLFYWARSYGGHLQKGDRYELLKKHISINFVDFPLLEHSKFHSRYGLLEMGVPESQLLTDHLEIHYIQMTFSRYNRGDLPLDGTLLEKWVYFLKHGSLLTVKEAAALDPMIEEVSKRLDEILNSPEMEHLFNMRKLEHDEANRVSTAISEVLLEKIVARAAKKGYHVPGKLVTFRLFHLRSDLLDRLFEQVFDAESGEEIQQLIETAAKKARP